MGKPASERLNQSGF